MSSSSSVLVLKEPEVARLITVADAIRALKEMLLALAAGQIANIPRRRATLPGFTLHSMSAADSRLRRAAWKQYSTTRQSARFHIGLYDTSSGQLLSLMQADRLGQLRTGALSAIAAEQLAPAAGIGRLALIGCGWQAQSQLECLSELLPVGSISVFCRDPEKRRRFAEEMGQRLGVAIEAADTAEACVAGAQTVITMTSARTPLVEKRSLDECRLVLAGGSNQPRNAELPAELVNAASRVVVDDIESCRNEAGDLILAAAQLVRPEALWERVESLASVMANHAKPHRSNWQVPNQLEQEGLILFKSVGMAACDLALASLVYDLACQSHTGSRIEL